MSRHQNRADPADGFDWDAYYDRWPVNMFDLRRNPLAPLPDIILPGGEVIVGPGYTYQRYAIEGSVSNPAIEAGLAASMRITK